MTSKYESVHKTPNGPGDARPTALQIIHDENLEGGLIGKVVLITGCSSGIGVETAKALFETGATLYLTARDLNKAKNALPFDLVSSERVSFLELDLNSLASVRNCVNEFKSKSQQLNILICNAGVMACSEGRTEDGFETQFGTNHLAHFLLINLLIPTILASTKPKFNSRIVILASIAHRQGEVHFDNLNLENEYNPWVAYAQSKTSNIWTANELERRYASKNVHSYSVQPGGIATGLLRHLSEEEKEGLMKNPDLKKQFKSPEQGAATSVLAAVSKALEGYGGKYLEDVQIGKPWKPSDGPWAPGYALHAYDEEKANKLWKVSLELVGLPEQIE